MANVRVFDLSKELGISNKEVIEAARNIGVSVRSHSSSISEVDAKRIKDKIKVPKSDGQLSTLEAAKETQEEVKIFRSLSGEEVVERRKGSSVVIRKKKKVEEQEPHDSLVEEKEEPKDISLTSSLEVPLSNKSVEEVKPTAHPIVLDEVLPAQEEKPIGEEIVSEVEPKIDEEIEAKVEAKEEHAEEAEKKVKKRGRKAKPKREEIIDEETLEELRRAFRTKLPGRRKEYLVEDRRLRSRHMNQIVGQERISNDLQQGQLKAREFTTKETTSAQVIPFPVKQQKRAIKLGESITVGDLAKRMGVKAADIIKKLMSLGMMVTINQSIDHETATIVAEELGYGVIVDLYEEKEILSQQEEGVLDQLHPRPPVVTVMGHVDHGKTTLLDAIRHTNVAEKEAGGITQHIGAYSVSLDGRKVVFIDTPGHEAFTAMRARGARVTDVVILVVAADDGVMPQTVEAVNHAKAAGVPIVVAMNKVDKPESDPDRIKRQLSEIGLVPEEWGGETMFAEVSARRKTGVKELLELVLLQADVLELKANPYKRANGTVIEAKLDRGRGPVATMIIKEGTLNVGDNVIAGFNYGRVRALVDDKGQRVNQAGPSMPVEVVGLSGVPSAGDRFYVVKDEKTAKEIVQHRELKEREVLAAKTRKLSLENLFGSLKEGETKELPLILKADTQGSVEALREALTKLDSDKCLVRIIHAGVGAINETDVVLASASNAVIVGFNIRPDMKAIEAADKEKVSLELHTIIYDVIDRIKGAMEGLLEPMIKERIIGHAEVKATFHVSKVGTIAGCYITDGKFVRGNNIRVVRDGVLVFEGKNSSLKRFKDDVREVQSGYECGIGIENFNDIKVGDTFEMYTFDEIKQKL
ncbi:MAG TPA: translation initiation factor IF-2 [Thermodesulfobacteriota bacterium]